jgi:hypothetical protein
MGYGGLVSVLVSRHRVTRVDMRGQLVIELLEEQRFADYADTSTLREIFS